MILTNSLTASVTLLAGGGDTASYHAVAHINDSRSHGQVGDNLLSLQEAIQLHNGTLLVTHLSAAEANQLSLIPGTGSNTDITWADIDGASNPVITIEQDLDPIADTGFDFRIQGVNNAPVLDFSGANLTRGFRATTSAVSFENLVLSGGSYGIDVSQADASGQSGAVLDRILFDGQTQFACRCTGGTANGTGRLVVSNCQFFNVPVAIVHAELPAGRATDFEVRDMTARNVGTAIQATIGPGGTANLTFERCDLEATGTAVRIIRPTGADRVAHLAGTHLRLRGSAGLRIDMTTQALTELTLRMLDIDVPGIALNTTIGNQTYGTIEDSILLGSVTLGTAYAPAPLEARNVQFRNGQVVLGSATNGLHLVDARMVGSSVAALTGTTQAVGCSFEGITFQTGLSASLDCEACYFPNPPSGANVIHPLPAPHLGSMSIAPEIVAIGTTVDLRADLPGGLLGMFLLGFTDHAPQLLPAPLHVYSIPSLTFLVPGIVSSQQVSSWMVPNHTAFLGFDLIAQIAVLPGPNVLAPPIHFPPGRRFVLR
jgi:hypothetical protein